MLSIIICSINKKLLTEVSQNISETIGIPYELIVIDNDVEELSITAAYNKGGKLAQYDNLCFMHEDIKFHTQSWGEIVVNLLKNNEIGLVGVSGVTYKTKAPITWSSSSSDFFRINAIQRFKNSPTRKAQINPENEKCSKVAVIDGLWMCTKKDVFNKVKFNEQILKGFHLYDIDLSVRIGKLNDVVVTHEILIEHFSEGKLAKNWLKESINWHKLYENLLPVTVEKAPEKQLENLYVQDQRTHILALLKTNFNVFYVWKMFFKLMMLDPVSVKTFIFFKFIISYSIGIPKIKKYINPR